MIKILVKPFFVMCFLVICFSCEKDLYEEATIEQRQGIKSRRISFEELNTNIKVIKELNLVKQKLKPTLLGNERIISVGDFFIETDDVLLLEYGELKSYTFPVYFTEDDAKLKNLVISEKLDGTYESKVLEYDLTPQEKIDLTNDDLKSITNPIVTTRVSSYEIGVQCVTVTITYLVACSDGYYHNGTDSTEWTPCYATSPPKIKVISEVFCGGGGGIPTPIPDIGVPGNSGGGPGGTPTLPLDYPNPQTNPEEYQNGITQPINPNLNNVLPTLNPCAELIAKDIDSVFNAKMIELNNKAATQNFESAYILYQNAIDGLQLSNEITGNQNAASANLIFQSNSTNSQSNFNAIAAIHCHLDDGSTFKVFSYADIIALAHIATISTRPPNELAIYVTTNSGTFALKVNNRILLRNKKSLLEANLRQNEIDFDNLVKTNFDLNKQKLGFLKFINTITGIGNPGIDFYEKDTATNKWNLLTLSSNGTAIIPIPCN